MCDDKHTMNIHRNKLQQAPAFNKKEYNKNINRRLLERGNWFGHNTPEKIKKQNSSSFNSNVGEITGKQYNDNGDKGMPMRNYEDYNKHDTTIVNPGLDFDLYDSKYNSKSNSNITYFDPYDNTTSSSNFSNVDEDNHLIPNIDPSTQFISNLNKISLRMYNMFQRALSEKKITNNITIISPYAILRSIIILYRASKNNTENEIQRAFMLPDKNTAYQLMINLSKEIKNVCVYNYIYVPTVYPLNSEYVQYVSDICDIKNYKKNISLAHLNRYIYETSGIAEAIPNILNEKSNILLTNISYFNTEWKQPFNQQHTEPSSFYGTTNNRNVLMMKQYGGTHRYCEDNINQVIEMDCNDITMGIILPKTKCMPKFNYNQYCQYDHQLKTINLRCVSIPKIQYQCRYKITDLLKKFTLPHLYSHADFSELIPYNSTYYVSDIIYRSIVNIHEGKQNSLKNNEYQNYNVMLIANHPFIFYFKHQSTNTLLYIGKYS